MPVYRLHIDSRFRDVHTTSSQPSFFLSNTMTNIKSMCVKHVQVANSIYNIRSGFNDQLVVSVDGGASFATYTFISSGFYSATQMVTKLQAFWQGLIGADGVTLSGFSLSWSLPANVEIDELTSSARHMLGLNGTTHTTVFLASPISVAFVSAQLQSTSNVFTSDHLMSRLHPFVTVPLVGGFGTMEYWEPHTQLQIDFGNLVLSTLDLRACDTASGMILTELSDWSMELEIYT